MTTQETKVISFESVQAKHKDTQKPALTRISSELRDLYSRHLTELLQRLFAVIDDELFKRSDKAESVTMQSQYFDVMRQIRVEATSLQASFFQHLLRRYEEFWRRKSQPLLAEHNGGLRALEEGGFSLLENEVLEEEIAISGMVEKGNNLFQRDLHALNKRIASLVERNELESKENPIAPFSSCEAFAAALKPLFLDLSTRLLIYKLFDRVVLSALGGVYQELNGFLVNEGILPTLSRTLKRSPLPNTSVYPSSGGVAEGSTYEEGIDENQQQAYAEVFQGMQRMLDGWRMQIGLPSAFVEERSGGSPVETGDILKALSVMQVPAALSGVSQPTTIEVKSSVLDQLLKMNQGEARSLERSEEDIIDMVSLIFDFILEDQNLPDPVKGLIARLQIPVVKVAILEKSFFGRKNHPVRLLLNALAHAGIGLDMNEGGMEGPVFKKIENIVHRVLDEFDQNVDLFSDLLDELIAFMDKEAQRSRLAEERTRQVTQSKEQLHLAKRKIAYEIASRLEGKTTPAAVRSFLYNTWKDVLVLAYLRRDKQPGDWEGALDVMDKLIWSVLPATDGVARKAIIQMIPRLLKLIRSGLESISLDPQTVAIVLKDLEACHRMRLIQPFAETPKSASTTGLAEAVTPIQKDGKVEIRDPELARAISEISANLPDIENLALEDLAKDPEDIGGSHQENPDLVVEEEYLFKARDLEVGEWVEFDDGRKRLRGKLSWKSQVTSTYVFVNRKGAKVVEIALADLAKRMNFGSARVIKDAGVPLMDRAFGALLNKLRGPATALA